MSKYSIDYLLNNILDTKKDYIENNQEKPLEFNKIFKDINDFREENDLEKIIRRKKTELKLNINGDEDFFKDKIEYISNSTLEIAKYRSLTKNSPDPELKNINIKYHIGYLDYLICACENNYGIEIGPWYFWNIILWKIRNLGKYNEQEIRKIWNKSNLKQDIIINKYGISYIEDIEINEIFNNIKKCIPEETLKVLYLKNHF